MRAARSACRAGARRVGGLAWAVGTVWAVLVAGATPTWGFEINAGDVFAGASVGVVRQTVGDAAPGMLASPVLGVRRLEPPGAPKQGPADRRASGRERS